MPELRYLTLVVPPPPGSLNPNWTKGRHWGAALGDRRRFADEVRIGALAALAEHGGLARFGAPMRCCRVVLTLITPTRQGPDLDNLCAAWKPGQDALIAAGVLADDGPDFITELRIRREVRPGARPDLIVEVIEQLRRD